MKVDNPVTFWRAQPTYILAALVFLLGAAGNLVHGEHIPNIFCSKSYIYAGHMLFNLGFECTFHLKIVCIYG